MPVVRFPRQQKMNTRALAILAVLFGAFVLLWRATGFITDWFWFQEVGYEKIFTTVFFTQLKMALLFGSLFFAILYGNLYLAARLSSRFPEAEPFEPMPSRRPSVSNRDLNILIFAGSIVLSCFAALQSAGMWENFLRYCHSTSFGATDPVFNRDIGFYVFEFPFLNQVYGWFMFAIVLTTLATGILYFLRRAFIFIPPRQWQTAPAARAHLSILAASLFILGIFGLWLELIGILFSKRGVVFGPGYTEVKTQLWVIKVLMGLSLLAAVGLLSYPWRRDIRIPAAGILLFFAVLLLGRGAYPAIVQKFQVVPNEIVLERPYLERNIKHTRLAYNLDSIEDRNFPVTENLTREDLKRNDLTIKNIRLWEHGPLLSTYAQLQEIRTYYKFVDIDNDRYMVNGEYRQVMLSARELSYRSLPSRTWVNEHLTYTHGYGAVLGPVNRISREGLPEFFIQDIPPVATTNVKITRPEIYYGETSNDYVFVRAKRPEFDYPVGDKNVYARYEGKGGVPLTFLRKLLYAARFSAFTILLSDDIIAETRVMYYRKVRERVGKVASFLHIDRDPYLVISQEGRLVWMLDAYTTTDMFPYSEPIRGVGNYIRNSVKATVDAYDGTVELYVSDPADPIIRTYAKIFPGVFKKMEEMPSDLKSHVRYPVGLFSIQANMYRAYHMQDPQVFYNKEDLWAIPARPAPSGGEQEMEPYYTIMRLPEAKKEEFILLLPFTPSKKDNMSAWMAARCDQPDYGRLIVYNFPKQRLVYGPRQIEARIDQDTEISKQLSLWNQRGSQAIRGSLLAIPIEKSILYVESLYLAAEKGSLPELKRVIVAFGNSIAMEESLELSLQRIFGGELLRDGEARRAEAVGLKSARDTALEALGHYRKAQEALKQGSWTVYGEELRRMDELLRSIERK